MKPSIFLLGIISLIYLLIFLFLDLASSGPMFVQFMIFWMFLWFVFNLLLTNIVYRDAIKNNNPNAVLMSILVFFSGILGVVIYFVIRKPQDQYAATPSSKQSTINKQSQYEHSFCSVCGSKTDNNSIFCQNCGATVQ